MINEQIRDREVRLIGTDGEQLGIMSAREAMKLAQEAELDLVKINKEIYKEKEKSETGYNYRCNKCKEHEKGFTISVRFES